MNYQAVVDYFEDICSKNKGILHTKERPHFFRIDGDEFHSAFKNFVGSPSVYLEMPEGRITGDTLDNAFASHEMALNLVTKVAPDDFTARLKAYNDMEQLGMDLFSRVVRDYQSSTNRIIELFDWKSIRMYKISFVAHNMFGMRFEFSIGERANAFRFYDNTKWTD